MVQLIPSDAELGLASPTLGPWFDTTGRTFPLPREDLSVEMNFGSFRWLPPATGLLSLAVRDAQPSALIDPLRRADGEKAFREGSLIALFRLLPEVEARLDALLADFLPSADGGAAAAGTPRRARVRHFALEIADAARLDTTLWDSDPPAAAQGADPADQAAFLGLRLDGTTLRNTDRPIRDLKRPGPAAPGRAVLQVGGSAADVSFWAFDEHGLALDPGAVAAWWQTLARDRFEDRFLWARGIDGTDRRTIAAADLAAGRRVHLVNPHEGPSDLLGDVTVTGASGTGAIRQQDATPVQLSLPDAAADRPRRVALLPNGTYAAQATLWPAATTFPDRDFVRMALVDLDTHLVGARPAADALELRAGARPPVRASEAPVLLEGVDAAAAAMVATLDGGGERHLVTSVLDRDWGAFPVAALPPGRDLPGALPDPEVTALRGGGAPEGDTVGRQRVLVQIEVGAALSGAWLRAWPQGFDDEAARHVRLAGGAAPVRTDGSATLAVALPAGLVAPGAAMGLDVLLVTADASRLYTDLRFERPAPLAGPALSLSAAAGPFLVCETGFEAADAAGLRGPGRVPPGATLISREAQPALVDPASLTAELSPETVASRLSAGLDVALTVPAFAAAPRGADPAALAAGGATVEQAARAGLDAVTGPGSPLPTQERLEVAAARLDGTTARAAIATAPALARYHESLPHQSGHPGVPAADEVHGTGAVLSGPAALPLVEALRDRTARATLPDLFQAARALLPALPDPAGPVHWTALLRTVAPGTEGEQALPLAAEGGAFPFGETLDDILGFFAASPIGVPPGVTAAIPEAEAVARALDRRVFAASQGLRDGLRALRAAFARAESFVYVETPALDVLSIGGDDSSPWRILANRLAERPGLHALVCLPVHLLPGTPRRLTEIRNALVADLPRSDRVSVISVNTGPGRSLRQSATTVIVDDAFAMTGSTHLWRRGLTFDASLAVATFDETLERGRPRALRQARRTMIAARLGVTPDELPDDPAELTLALAQLAKRGGGHRLATEKRELPELTPTETDLAAWDPDGSRGAGTGSWLADLLALLQAAGTTLADDVTDGPA